MQFGQAIGTAALTFAVTNIDDAFVLVTFFAESVHSETLTPLKIVIGQFVGFTVIVTVSLIGFGVSLVLPSEPIGFLGLFPILLGFWKLLAFFETNDDVTVPVRAAGIKAILKVAFITILNGGDNIGTYIPLFSQVRGAEIAVYVVVYYILLGVWCLVGFLIIKQKHLLAIIEKFVGWFIPFLYGPGRRNTGRVLLATLTVALLLISIGLMVWYTFFIKRRRSAGHVDREPDENGPNTAVTEVNLDTTSVNREIEPITLDANDKTDSNIVHPDSPQTNNEIDTSTPHANIPRPCSAKNSCANNETNTNTSHTNEKIDTQDPSTRSENSIDAPRKNLDDVKTFFYKSSSQMLAESVKIADLVDLGSTASFELFMRGHFAAGQSGVLFPAALVFDWWF
ncbi:cadmium resistance transporter-domain-containing protein [Xylaria scruposa]|nr:cadmium resistance transporter-domain-containing protein [Xylaria scruposa]